MGDVPNAPGPSPILGSLGPSHQWSHKSRALLWDPPCAHGIVGTPQREVRDSLSKLVIKYLNNISFISLSRLVSLTSFLSILIIKLPNHL